MTELIVPFLLCAAACCALYKKQDVYSLLLLGAQDGLRTLLSIVPALIVLLSAVTMLRESGCIELLTGLLAPACKWIGIPPEVVPLMLIRPMSGSAALAVGADLMRTYGPDSLVGRTAPSCSAARRQPSTPSASILAQQASGKRATRFRPRSSPI